MSVSEDLVLGVSEELVFGSQLELVGSFWQLGLAVRKSSDLDSVRVRTRVITR